MMYNNLLFNLFFVIPANHYFTFASNVEGIVGGKLASPHQFTYHVSIQVKENFSNFPHIIGSGGIIADKFVLSAAHCFLNDSGDLVEYNFGVVADTIKLNYQLGQYIELTTGFGIPYNPNISHLKIPMFSESFENVLGILSGYGWNAIDIGINSETGVMESTSGRSDFLLRFIEKKIINHELCKKHHPFADPIIHICAMTETYSGVCKGDSGSPVVIGKKIVGIISRGPISCFNNERSLSTRITGYLSFIETLKVGFQFTEAKAFRNRPHILNPQISAMKAEGIIAGELARAHEFTYQVSVQGKQNYSDERLIIGAGGVIDDEFVLSAAHVFLDVSGDLDEYTFGILLDSIDLMNGNGIYVEVDVIYIPYFSRISKLQDLAVLKLKNKLNLESNPHVTKLNLPKATERFENVWTVIVGYGWNNILVIKDENTAALLNITGSTDGLLRFARTKILKHEVCITDYSFLNPYTHVCSITESSTGACQGDSGTPLVAENTVIGILSQSPLDCMSNKLPSISTRVTGYINFIELIMNGYQFPGTKIYRNRPHVMEPRRKKTKINNKADDINNRN